MTDLRTELRGQAGLLKKQIHDLVETAGTVPVGQVTVGQVIGGMRGVIALVCDTSLVDAEKGLIVRGIPILELASRLPEEIFFLLCTGRLPAAEETSALEEEFRKHAEVPQYVWDVLRAMPADSHPMTMFSTGILVMERDSIFRRRYSEGMHKDEYWEATLEDSIRLLAKLPALAAGIYRIHTGLPPWAGPVPALDWGASFARMLGLPDPGGEFSNLMRLYLTLHCDHEGGNVSAFTCHTVGSALSNPYYAVSAGMNGLAGPLHGLANQECLHFVRTVMEKFGGVPTAEQLSAFVVETLQQGSVIPGYGHAVLRNTDPRFTAFHVFGERVCANDDIFRIVDLIFKVTPGVLRTHARIKDPWPNVDAISGSLLYHFGLKQYDFYTVLFGVSRAMGMCAQLIINRAVGSPITRPKSVTSNWLREAGKGKRVAA